MNKKTEKVETCHLSQSDLHKKIDKNRDEINKWLSGNYPLDVVYMRIRMLSAQNDRLISQLKKEV